MAETYKGEFYCVKCKEKREAEGDVVVSNGRRMAEGICPVCGTKLNRILGKACNPVPAPTRLGQTTRERRLLRGPPLASSVDKLPRARADVPVSRPIGVGDADVGDARETAMRLRPGVRVL